jgi:hypothetical protein
MCVPVTSWPHRWMDGEDKEKRRTYRQKPGAAETAGPGIGKATLKAAARRPRARPRIRRQSFRTAPIQAA